MSNIPEELHLRRALERAEAQVREREDRIAKLEGEWLDERERARQAEEQGMQRAATLHGILEALDRNAPNTNGGLCERIDEMGRMLREAEAVRSVTADAYVRVHVELARAKHTIAKLRAGPAEAIKRWAESQRQPVHAYEWQRHRAALTDLQPTSVKLKRWTEPQHRVRVRGFRFVPQGPFPCSLCGKHTRCWSKAEERPVQMLCAWVEGSWGATRLKPTRHARKRSAADRRAIACAHRLREIGRLVRSLGKASE